MVRRFTFQLWSASMKSVKGCSMQGIGHVFVLAVGCSLTIQSPLGYEMIHYGGGLAAHAQESQEGVEDPAERSVRVLLPGSALVSLDQEALTGRLISFDESGITLMTDDTTRMVPHAQIQEIRFQGDVWLGNSSGTIERMPVRGPRKTLEGLPVTALLLDDPPETATLSLATMTPRGFEQLSEDIDLTSSHALSRILFDSAEAMTVTINTELKIPQ